MRTHTYTYQPGETSSHPGWFSDEHVASDGTIWLTPKTLFITFEQRDIPSLVAVELGKKKSGDDKSHI